MSVRQLSTRKARGNSLRQAVHALMEGLEERRLLSGDIRLIGITGNLQSGDPNFGNDETLYEIKYGSAGTSDPAFLDGFENFANPPDVLTISDSTGVSEGRAALRVDVQNNAGVYWGIRSGNVRDLLVNGGGTLSYDMMLDGKELNGGSFGGGADNSFNGYAQNNKLAVSLNISAHGWFERDFDPLKDSDSMGQNATWSGQNGTRVITWDLTTLKNDQGITLSDYIVSNPNFNDARIILVTQGADTNGHVGPMRFYFDNFNMTGGFGTTKFADFELLSTQKIIKLPHVPDTDTIAFNPETGLLHRISGSKSYRNDPTRIGYRDDQFMETINMDDPENSQVGIFNANYEGGPIFDRQPDTMNYGLPAPFPNWVFPDHRRTDSETDPSFGAAGPNEFHAMHDFTWSTADHLFFGTDESGIYKLTADGQSTFLAFPSGMDNPKGITFWTSGGVKKLLVSERDGPSLFTIDPATGQPVGDTIQILNENGFPVPGILSLVEDPVTGTLLGISKVVGDTGNAENRLLVRIDPSAVFTDPFSGLPSVTAVPLGGFGTYMSDLAFIVPQPSVNASSFEYEALPQRLVIKFSQNVGNSISAADLKLEKLGAGGGEIALGAPTYDLASNTVTFAIPGLLTDGNYRATMTAGGVTNTLDMPITANEEINFFWLNGDLNRDRTVSISDFIDLASRFNQPATKWSDGDLNYDGQITISDFIDLAANFNHSIPPPAPAQAPASATADSDAESTVLAKEESTTLFSKRNVHKKQSHHRRAHKAAPARRGLSFRGVY